MKLKPALFLIHRWLGIGMCLLFALWFASGIVMMYVEYPELTEDERLANLSALDTRNIHLSPFQASQSIANDKAFTRVKLTSILGRPTYQFEGISGAPYFVFADDGELFAGLNESSALNAAKFSGFNEGSNVASYDSLVELDQWTVSAGLDRYRPLHKISLNDEAGTVLYISDKSGQVVRDTHLKERFWNWLGSTVHWIYPVQLRKNASLWNDVIVYLSLLGIISVFTGAIIGFMRIRIRKPYSGNELSPYTGWMKWHHILGLFSLVFVSTFIFSGLMSMGPWGVFSSNTSATMQIDRYLGGSIVRLASLPEPNYATIQQPVKEIDWLKIAGQNYYAIVRSLEHREVNFGEGGDDNQADLLLEKIREAIPRLLPDASLLSMDAVQQADNYYYSRHNRYLPFPAYRAKFDDPESTWYHIDLKTGEIINRVTDASRRERWLFNGLHSLDFQFLLKKGPLWDSVVILLSLLGLGFSLTSVVIAWRRLTV